MFEYLNQVFLIIQMFSPINLSIFFFYKWNFF